MDAAGGIDACSTLGANPYARCVNPEFSAQATQDWRPVYPSVRPFTSDFPRMNNNKQYEHLIDVTTAVDAHLNTSLVRIPSQLLPDEWTIDVGAEDAATFPDGLAIRRVFADPMILTMEQILTPDECTELIQLGERIGYERSLTTSGVSDTRTSASAYLPDIEIKHRLLKRIARIVGEPVSHIECGPIIRYQVGQQFEGHYDSSLPATFGRRLTVFVPLDSVEGEDGGHTGFPLLGYRFPPKAGTAIIWRNYEPSAQHEDFDLRMKHAGEPPKKGAKYAVNVWVYNMPFRHTMLKAGNNQSVVVNSTAAIAATLPIGPLVTREAGEVPLLVVPAATLIYPWLVPLDVGAVTVYPTFPGTQFLLLRIPDFVPLQERQELIAAAEAKGWHDYSNATTIVNGEAEQYRKSKSCWVHDTAAQEKIQNRVARLLGVPPTHVEASYVTKYAVNEWHHPHFDSQRTRVPGRLMSVHIVLSSFLDEPAGELHFPQFHRKFRPTPGMAIAWRNYRPGDEEHDPAARHGMEPAAMGDVHTLTVWVWPRPIKRRSNDTAAQTSRPAATEPTTSEAAPTNRTVPIDASKKSDGAAASAASAATASP